LILRTIRSAGDACVLSTFRKAISEEILQPILSSVKGEM